MEHSSCFIGTNGVRSIVGKWDVVVLPLIPVEQGLMRRVVVPLTFLLKV
jgi:hypothetical protein